MMTMMMLKSMMMMKMLMLLLLMMMMVMTNMTIWFCVDTTINKKKERGEESIEIESVLSICRCLMNRGKFKRRTNIQLSKMLNAMESVVMQIIFYQVLR